MQRQTDIEHEGVASGKRVLGWFTAPQSTHGNVTAANFGLYTAAHVSLPAGCNRKSVFVCVMVCGGVLGV